MKLVATKTFEKKYRKITSKNPLAKLSIDKTLNLMNKDIFNPILETHKLSGNLSDLWSSNCGKDCRIIFSFELSKISNEKVILLLNIGTHKEVY